jgi:hypothetical protein
MVKITDYFVCSGVSTTELGKNVSEALNNGWQPLGGISAVAFRDGSRLGQMFYQAIVRYSIQT